MTWREHSRDPGRWRWPYIVRLRSSKGSLLYFGASHTYDPNDKQVSEIERLWSEFHPDIAFNEGGDPPIEKSRDEEVIKWGESGLVRYLAARDNVPVIGIDPVRGEGLAFLRKTFSDEQLKLSAVLQVVVSHIKNRGIDTVDQELERVFPIFAATPGLRAPPNSIAELRECYARYFPNEGSYKDARTSWFDPTVSGKFLNDMARRSSEYRDQHMVDLFTRHVKAEQQRVFAVVGGTHVAMQEQAIRRLLR